MTGCVDANVCATETWRVRWLSLVRGVGQATTRKQIDVDVIGVCRCAAVENNKQPNKTEGKLTEVSVHENAGVVSVRLWARFPSRAW